MTTDAKINPDDEPRAADDDAEPMPVGVTLNIPAPKWPPQTVADLMTRKLITVEEDEPIGELEAWMERFRFHHLPVVDGEMKLVGIITRSDFLHAALGTTPHGKPAPKVDASTPANAIMRKSVVVAKLDSSIADACRVMLKEQLGCLPVVLEDNKLVGILTATDFTRLVLDLLERC